MAETLLEMANERGKKLLIESHSFSVPSKNIEVLSNTTTLVESKGTTFKAIAIIRDVPSKIFFWLKTRND